MVFPFCLTADIFPSGSACSSCLCLSVVATFALKPADKRTFSARGDAVVAHAPSRLTSAITARLMVLCLSRVFFIVPFPCSVFFVDRVILSFHFFAAGAGVPEEDGVTEGAGAAARWTVVPVVRESDGLTITLSDSVTPLRISD